MDRQFCHKHASKLHEKKAIQQSIVQNGAENEPGSQFSRGWKLWRSGNNPKKNFHQERQLDRTEDLTGKTVCTRVIASLKECNINNILMFSMTSGLLNPTQILKIQIKLLNAIKLRSNG